jgi:hypothetical protein
LLSAVKQQATGGQVYKGCFIRPRIMFSHKNTSRVRQIG